MSEIVSKSPNTLTVEQKKERMDKITEKKVELIGQIFDYWHHPDYKEFFQSMAFEYLIKKPIKQLKKWT